MHPLRIHAIIETSPKGEKKEDVKFMFKIIYAVWSSFQLYLSNMELHAKALCIVSSGESHLQTRPRSKIKSLDMEITHLLANSKGPN